MLRRSSFGLLLAALAWTVSLSAQVKTIPKTQPKRTVMVAIDINSAPEENLMSTLGIDKAAAKKIVDGRPYRNKRELVSRQMLTSDQYNKIKNQIVAKQPLNKPPFRN